MEFQVYKMPDFDVIHRSNISHEETLTARFVWSYEIVQCYGPFMLIDFMQ